MICAHGKAILPLIVSLVAMSGCSVLPAAAPLPKLHDFGPLPTDVDAPPAAIHSITVDAPAWLADDAIHYRFLYADPTALRSYAYNRWTAAPADLLGAGLGYLLPYHPAAASGDLFELHVTVLEFEQDFSAATQASATVVMDVSLDRPADGKVIAQRRFRWSVPTEPGVAGAVSGLAKLGAQSETDIAAWAREQLK
jgi:cholesterol transport system auxiliary component